MTKVDKLEAALDAGQLWRAKEILAGRIGSADFSPELCERFGQLLLRMGDDLQAGKYLFLSGVRRPEYESAIRLFVRRYSRAGWQSLLGSFPAAARCAVWAGRCAHGWEATKSRCRRKTGGGSLVSKLGSR